MDSSPNTGNSRRQVIRELSRLSPSRSPALPAPTPRSQHDHDETEPPITTSSVFNPEHEAIHSTQQMETQTMPVIRSTARRFAHYNPEQQPHVPTSAVRKEFGDFDSYELEQSEEDSIEIARGGKRSLRSTPARSGLGPEQFMSSANFDSLYDVTPPSKARAPTRRGNAAETGSLRRDAQLRRASAVPQTENSQSNVRRRSTLAEIHARVSDEDSFQDERPPTITSTFKGGRFGTTRSREVSANQDMAQAIEISHLTPQRAFRGTPRSGNTIAKDTQQSFMLPDLPNLTELVSGVFKDGTPVFSRTSRSRLSRFSSAPKPNPVPNYIPINNVPVPEDAKALFAALQLLKEKVTQLEKENAEAVKIIEEREAEITDLKAEKKAQQAMRSSDSALGSTDEEGNGNPSWKLQKSRLDASVETLKSKLDRSERKLSVADKQTKRVTDERDQLQEQLTKAFVSSEEMKHENEALQLENHELRIEVDDLRSDNDRLRTGNEDLRVTTARYEEETLQLRNNLTRKDKAVREENDTLHAELARARAQNNEEALRWARKEAELRDRKNQQEQADLAKLNAENEALRTQLETAKAKRSQEENQWARQEAELRNKLDQRDETIRNFRGTDYEEINETVCMDNENLRMQLQRVHLEREEEQQQWERKEERLRRKIEKRENAVRDMQDVTRDIFDARATSQRPVLGHRRAASRRQDKDTQMRLSERVAKEIRNTQLQATNERNTQARRAGNPGPNRFTRTSSAPVDHYIVDANDGLDSTTDLSPVKIRPVVTRSAASAAQLQNAEADLTYLSFMDGDELARLRRTLEEERAASKRITDTDHTTKYQKNDTVRSTASAQQPASRSLPRKSSMKDLSTRMSIPVTEIEDRTQTKQVDASIISNISRRRRSAPIEMTSAFIIPDITVRSYAQAQGAGAAHEHSAKDCTVCHRSTSDPVISMTGGGDEVLIPKLVPISSRNIDDSNATVRPAQSPQNALALVLKELEDELAHLKADLAVQEAKLQAHDPALGKRQRKAISARIQVLLGAIDVKFDQIYALYDVLEGQKADGLLEDQDKENQQPHDAANNTQRHRMTEVEIDNTLRSVGLDPKEARKGKKVIIESAEDSAFEDDELPEWSGISDTESMADLGRYGVRGNGVA